MTRFFALTLLSLISGCNYVMSDKVDIKQKPHPTKRYEITMTIDGAPGPFDSVLGSAAYEISNEGCVPADPFSGARNTPSYVPDVELVRMSDDVYKGFFYIDLPKDENYYGLGVCHWTMTSAGISLVVHGVNLGPFIEVNDIVAQKSVTQYASKELYLDNTVKDLNVGAVPLSDYISKHPEKFFSITLAAREVVK